MQKSGFFNAVLVDGEYDRKYNANDYSDNLAVVISNGVLRSINDDLKVTATGLYVTVAPGRAWINGHYYSNDSAYTFAVVSPPVGGTRYDRVILRLNSELNSRRISLVYVQGEAANEPTKPPLVRNGNIYDLCLADIFVDTNATSLQVEDMRGNYDVCGWLYSTSGDNTFFTSLDNAFGTWFSEKKDTLASVTLFKKYTFTRTLSAPTSRASFNIPQYDPDTCFLEIYVNGIYDTRHTIEGTVAVFQGTLTAGTKIVFNCYKSIDGTGIMTVADEITELQNEYEEIAGTAKFSYFCSGENDNWSLSQIAEAINTGEWAEDDITEEAAAFLEKIGGAEFITGLGTHSQITIEVIGHLGATTPVYGAGTEESRYRWFQFGHLNDSNHKVIFDFAKCEKIGITCAQQTSNIIFYGKDQNIKNANIDITNAGAYACHVLVFGASYNTGNINVDNCRIWVNVTGKIIVAENGNFTNCYVYGISTTDRCLLFCPKSDGFIRLIGGTYYAYIKASVKTSAIMYVYSTETNAVIMAYNINCPTVSQALYYQQYLAVGYGGKTYINGVVSTMDKLGSYVDVVGQVWKSKR